MYVYNRLNSKLYLILISKCEDLCSKIMNQKNYEYLLANCLITTQLPVVKLINSCSDADES